MMWVVLATEVVCRIYDYEPKTHELNMVAAQLHPQSRLKSSDLGSDEPGRYKSQGAPKSAFQPKETPKENEIEIFAREIAHSVDEGRRQNLYDKLVVVSAPKMQGRINGFLNPHVKELIIKEINKDYSHLTEKDLKEVLKTELHTFL